MLGPEVTKSADDSPRKRAKMIFEKMDTNQDKELTLKVLYLVDLVHNKNNTLIIPLTYIIYIHRHDVMYKIFTL